ncbi:MAG: nitrate/nitrite transporter NrtS [Acidiferrobacterales bacterium]
MSDWVKTAFQKTVYVHAIKVTLVVGTILALINHGDTLLEGSFSAKTLFQIALTYLVPYGVSIYASVEAIRNAK